jgi:hypothetical protein
MEGWKIGKASEQEYRAFLRRHELSFSTTNISGTDNDFDRPAPFLHCREETGNGRGIKMVRDGVFLYRYPGTPYLATIMLSLRDKIHPPGDAFG